MLTSATPRGLGIDKPQVRLVVHWTLPATSEAYSQEARRNGELARCGLWGKLWGDTPALTGCSGRGSAKPWRASERRSGVGKD
jgi:superfamily II DNA/RNA helicase